MRWAVALFCGAWLLAAAPPAAISARPVDAFRATATGNVCRTDYNYAGAQDARRGAGVHARLRAVTQPNVTAGHVAGWLGVGGPGRGPNGTTEWLQAGYSAMAEWPQQIYYEVTLPNKPTRYHTIQASLQVGETHVLTVMEVKNRPGSWQVLLDGRPASPEIALPASHGRFAPQVLAETWNAGTKRCNHYSYSFASIRVASARSGSWAVPKAGYVWRDVRNQVVRLAQDSFVARSPAAYTVAARDVPPLLGALASTLAARPLTTRCGRQRVPVRERPAGRLALSEDVCQILLGYAVAEPHVPAASSRPGFVVAATALGFLRGVARAAGVRSARVDCRAVGTFSRALHVLGATVQQARSLRTALLRDRDRIRPRLSFHPGCRFR